MTPSFPIRAYLAKNGSRYSRMPDLDKVRTARARDTHLDPDYELHYHGPNAALAQNAKIIDSLANIINVWSLHGDLRPTFQMLRDMEVAVRGEGLISTFLLQRALSDVKQRALSGGDANFVAGKDRS